MADDSGERKKLTHLYFLVLLKEEDKGEVFMLKIHKMPLNE